MRFSLEQQQGRAVWGSVGEGRAAPPSSYLAHMALASGGSHADLKPHAPKKGLKASGAMPTFERKSHVPVLRPRAVFACYPFTFILKPDPCARPERDGEA